MSTRAPWQHWSRHAIPLSAYLLLSAAWMHPALTHLHTAIIGVGAGDNLSFVWNIWWTRTALLAPDEALFWTPMLFAPLGTSLVLHSLAPLPSAVAAAFVPWLSLPAAYNVVSWLTVFLNSTCAYAAGYLLTGTRLPAFASGLVFGGAPFLLARLQGHLSVLSAWGLPLLVVVLVPLVKRPSVWRGLALGLILAVLAYTDYYYAIFGVVLSILYVANSCWRIRVSAQPVGHARRRAAAVTAVASLCLFAVGLWAAVTGGDKFVLAGQTISITSGFNARVVAWVLGLVAALCWWSPSVRVDRRPRPVSGFRGALISAALTAALLMLSLFAAAWDMWRAGDYISQPYRWRSAPAGIDVAALILGNPFGLLAGSSLEPLFERCGVDRVESAVWLGVAPLLLCGVAVRRLRTDPDVRVWLGVGAIFGIWALGPYLTACGWNTAMMLPQTLLRFVPLLSNARIPGRAFVVALLAVALVVALMLSRLCDTRRRQLFGTLAVAAILIDYWPAPHPMLNLQASAVDAALARLEPGIVLNVPLGLRDGFGEQGHLDHRDLFAQTVHGQPMMGGFVARLSPRITRSYAQDPILHALLAASEHRALSNHDERPTRTPILACTARYLRVDRDALSDELESIIRRNFILESIAADDRRLLYDIRGLRNGSCPTKSTEP